MGLAHPVKLNSLQRSGESVSLKTPTPVVPPGIFRLR